MSGKGLPSVFLSLWRERSWQDEKKENHRKTVQLGGAAIASQWAMEHGEMKMEAEKGRKEIGRAHV